MLIVEKLGLVWKHYPVYSYSNCVFVSIVLESVHAELFSRNTVARASFDDRIFVTLIKIKPHYTRNNIPFAKSTGLLCTTCMMYTNIIYSIASIIIQVLHWQAEQRSAFKLGTVVVGVAHHYVF